MSTAWTQEFGALTTCEDDSDERPAHSSPQQITMGTTSHIHRHSNCRCVWGPPCSRKQEWFGWRSDGWSVDNRKAEKECIITLPSFWWSFSDYSFCQWNWLYNNILCTYIIYICCVLGLNQHQTSSFGVINALTMSIYTLLFKSWFKMLLKVSYAYKGFIYLIQIYFIIIILKYYLFEYILQFI